MKRLYRSERDKKLFGVCGGLGEVTGIDSTIIRILLVLLTFFSSGAFIVIYVIAAIVMPKDPTYTSFHGGQSYGGHGGGLHGGHGGGGSFYGAQNQNWDSQTRTNQGFYPPNTTTRGKSIDDLMEDIEKKALAKELEELKAKLAKYEKDNKGEE